MAAVLSAQGSAQQKHNDSAVQPLKASLIKSGALHVGVILAFTIGLPFVKPDDMILSAPISVEIVDISDVTTTNKVAPPKKKEEPEKPPEPAQKKEAPPKMTAEKPPELSKPTPPDVKPQEKLPEPDAPPPLERTPVKKPEPPKKKPEVTKTVEPKPKTEEPKKEEPKEKPQEQSMDSLLKNLFENETPKTEGEEPLKPDAQPETGQIARLSDQLSMSEQDALRRQLAGCWNVLAGARDAQELVVEIRVVMNRDRTVNRASILDTGRYNRDTHFRAAADAALRALRNPKCSPLQLPPEKYDQWKTVLIVFDPRDML